MAKFDWSPSRVRLLEKLWCKNGLSSQDVANEFYKAYRIRVTRNMICGKVHRLGFEQGRIPRSAKTKNVNVPKRKFFGMDRVPKSKPGIFRDIELDDYDATVRRVRNGELEHDQCSWPYGDPKLDDFRYCGETRLLGRPYCEHHLQRAYRKRA